MVQKVQTRPVPGVLISLAVRSDAQTSTETSSSTADLLWAATHMHEQEEMFEADKGGFYLMIYLMIYLVFSRKYNKIMLKVLQVG